MYGKREGNEPVSMGRGLGEGEEWGKGWGKEGVKKERGSYCCFTLKWGV